MTFRLTTRPGHPTFTDLPWDQPLVGWVSERLVTPPRGISRHVVRFAAYGPDLYALKEIPDHVAEREYRLLRELAARNVAVVEAVGVVTGRDDDDGEPLDGVLITEHLRFSLPYRTLFANESHVALWQPLLDALVQLLVRIHHVGFFWGDCSLSNTLFRRDAGMLVANLVDAETGELHPQLSRGQREHDLQIAVENLAGELLDLQAAGLLSSEIDPLEVIDEVPGRYAGLWGELHADVVIPVPDRHWVNQRVRRLNELGFDVLELQLEERDDGWHLHVETGVAEQGFHSRKLLTLTGLDVQENQARRLLNDIELFRERTAWAEGVRPASQVAALRWLTEVFQPTIELVAGEVRGKLEPAELFHQILEHRWFLSEAAGEDVGREVAVTDYVERVLRHRPDERAVVEPPTAEVPVVTDG